VTILEPILYANGALRLTDHGPRGGGFVLVHAPSGRQCSVSDTIAEIIDRSLSGEPVDPSRPFDPLAYFERIEGWHGLTLKTDKVIAQHA
jgi:hypothetical protein